MGDHSSTICFSFLCFVFHSIWNATLCVSFPWYQSLNKPLVPHTVGAVFTTGTVPVSSSTQATNNPPSDGTTTTSVILLVAVVIILVVIVVGVVILVVLFRTKKRKQKLVIDKLQTNTIQNEDIDVKLKQEETTKKAASSSVDHPPYEVSNLLYQSMDQHHNPPSTTNVLQGNDFYTVPNVTHKWGWQC